MSGAVQRAAVGVGSNYRQSRAIAAALTAMREVFGPLEVSSTYASPVQAGAGAPYWNLAVSFESRLDWRTLRAHLKSIEARLGRERRPAAVPRVLIDLDLLLLGDSVVADPLCVLPAPAILGAAYVLVPLSELLPDWRHPAARSTLAELAAATPRAELEMVAGPDFMLCGVAATPAAQQ